MATKRAAGVEPWLAHLKNRREQALAMLDISKGHGLEIGPLDATVANSELDDVSYVDVFDAAGVREHYKDDANVILELIPEIHYPHYVDGEFRPLRVAAAPGAPYDWVIGSHVIEHVQDVIGWLNDISAMVTENGALFLIVPDRRYCFDRFRPPTTVGQMLEAHAQEMDRPGVRAVYDYFSSVVPIDTAATWQGKPPPGLGARMYTFAQATAEVEKSVGGEYIDSHVWMFTPNAFVDQINELRALGVIDWYVESMKQDPGTLEFWAVLRKGDDSAGLRRESSDVPGWLEDEWAAIPIEVAELRLEQVGGGKFAALSQELAASSQELAALKASRSFRLGNLLLTPLRFVKQSLVRRGVPR